MIKTVFKPPLYVSSMQRSLILSDCQSTWRFCFLSACLNQLTSPEESTIFLFVSFFLYLSFVALRTTYYSYSSAISLHTTRSCFCRHPTDHRVGWCFPKLTYSLSGFNRKSGFLPILHVGNWDKESNT